MKTNILAQTGILPVRVSCSLSDSGKINTANKTPETDTTITSQLVTAFTGAVTAMHDLLARSAISNCYGKAIIGLQVVVVPGTHYFQRGLAQPIHEPYL